MDDRNAVVNLKHSLVGRGVWQTRPGYPPYMFKREEVGGTLWERDDDDRDLDPYDSYVPLFILDIYCMDDYVVVFMGGDFCLAGGSPAVPFLCGMAAIHPAAMLVKKDHIGSELRPEREWESFHFPLLYFPYGLVFLLCYSFVCFCLRRPTSSGPAGSASTVVRRGQKIVVYIALKSSIISITFDLCCQVRNQCRVSNLHHIHLKRGVKIQKRLGYG